MVQNLIVKDLGFITDDNCPIKDHLGVCFDLKGEKRAYQPKVINYRKWKSINVETFKTEFETFSASFPDASDSNQMALWYHETLSKLADSHAPLITKEVSRRSNPWYNEQIREMKQTARKLERKWKKTKLSVDDQTLKEHYTSMYRQINTQRIVRGETGRTRINRKSSIFSQIRVKLG